ncbi:MAG TPA: sodium-dependent transporter, partial [Clostridiales bacterium]|nr:sodium-dependent transporter [Clostridiales bacterium]
KNGGGAFVLAYILIVIFIGFSLTMGEMLIGRATQLNAMGAYRKLNKKLTWVGALGVLTAFIILSFYCIVGGWVINYMIKTLTGALSISDTEALGNMFGELVSNPVEPIIYGAIFMLITLVIVLGGIGEGIEKASKFMMPALFVMIIVLAIRSLTLPGASEGLKFFLYPDFSEFTVDGLLAALGQVFFSLSLGMGIMITYGSYLSKDSNLPQASIYITFLDTLVALLAGLAILPAVFAFGFEPAQGPGLMFVTLPAVFSQMPAGVFFGFIFFALVLLAALTSSISLLEVCVTYVVDEWKWDRKKATWILALIIFLVGIPASLSNGPWAHIAIFKGMGFFDTYDYITSYIFLPIGGLMSCILIGWLWGTKNALDEITNQGRIQFAFGNVWSFLIKYVAPIAIAVIFITSITS